MAIDLGDYNDVASRIQEFRAKHPDGSLRPVDPKHPYDIVTLDDATFIVYSAAAYRTPDDSRPGIGIAWEPFPGKTNFTRDSELQNAETSAWGRAIVATLAADTRSGVASQEEVRNRDGATSSPAGPRLATEKQRKEIVRMVNMENATIPNPWPIEDTLTMRDASTILESMKAEKKEPKAERKATLKTAPGETPEGAVPVYAEGEEPF